MSGTTSNRYGFLLGYCAVSFILLVLGGWLTYLGLGDWYYELNFPQFQPPSWLFTVAWAVVLTGLALGTWLITSRAEENVSAVLLALILYGAQCILNAGWSLLFFPMQRPDIALWELLVFDIVLLLMVYTYGRVSKLAALLLAPYGIWLALSTAINLWIVSHNTFA